MFLFTNQKQPYIPIFRSSSFSELKLFFFALALKEVFSKYFINFPEYQEIVNVGAKALALYRTFIFLKPITFFFPKLSFSNFFLGEFLIIVLPFVQLIHFFWRGVSLLEFIFENFLFYITFFGVSGALIVDYAMVLQERASRAVVKGGFDSPFKRIATFIVYPGIMLIPIITVPVYLLQNPLPFFYCVLWVFLIVLSIYTFYVNVSCLFTQQQTDIDSIERIETTNYYQEDILRSRTERLVYPIGSVICFTMYYFCIHLFLVVNWLGFFALFFFLIVLLVLFLTPRLVLSFSREYNLVDSNKRSILIQGLRYLALITMIEILFYHTTDLVKSYYIGSLLSKNQVNPLNEYTLYPPFLALTVHPGGIVFSMMIIIPFMSVSLLRRIFFGSLIVIFSIITCVVIYVNLDFLSNFQIIIMATIISFLLGIAKGFVVAETLSIASYFRLPSFLYPLIFILLQVLPAFIVGSVESSILVNYSVFNYYFYVGLGFIIFFSVLCIISYIAYYSSVHPVELLSDYERILLKHISYL